MKKLISIILSLVFVLCLLPSQVFATPITKVEVTGIDAPVVGKAPDMNATAGNGYYNLANRIQWKEYNEDKIYQRDLSASETFRAGYYYAVFVTVFTDADIPFTSQTTGTINGKTAQMQEPQDNGCSIVLIYNFSEIQKEPVKELDLTIPAPVDGEKPDYTKLDGNSYYSDNGLNGTSTRIYKNGIAWYKSTTSAMTPGTGETFRADADYKLKISLLPKEGYFFHENISVMINGKTATVEFFDDGSINASVSLTAAGPAHTHTPSEWRTTGAYHYKACTTCGEFLDQEDHKGGVATCAEKGKCTVCGYEYIDVHENHTPDTSEWIARGDMYHFHACKLCGAHCDIADHEISDDWKQDENNHWRTCTVCNEVLTETQMAHEMTGEKCTTCNYDGSKSDNTPSNPTETTPDSTVPQQQDKGNGGMPWWSLLLIGLSAVVVGVIVGAFVLKQKKKV